MTCVCMCHNATSFQDVRLYDYYRHYVVRARVCMWREGGWLGVVHLTNILTFCLDGAYVQTETSNAVLCLYALHTHTEGERESTHIYIYTHTDRKTRLSVTLGHRTVQEGLSMVSCRESITKSKHVCCFLNFLLQIFALEGFVKAQLA